MQSLFFLCRQSCPILSVITSSLQINAQRSKPSWHEKRQKRKNYRRFFKLALCNFTHCVIIIIRNWTRRMIYQRSSVLFFSWAMILLQFWRSLLLCDPNRRKPSLVNCFGYIKQHDSFERVNSFFTRLGLWNPKMLAFKLKRLISRIGWKRQDWVDTHSA